MKVKIATWNINSRNHGTTFWDFVDKELAPDILLLQECRTVPDSYLHVGTCIGGTRPWGSFILSKMFDLKPVLVPGHEGWVIGARTLVYGQELFVFSIHAKLKDIGGYVVPHLKNIFTDIMQIAENSENIIIGGDLNAARLFDETGYQPGETSHNKFFDWLENDLGLVNVHFSQSGKEERTIRRKDSPPYQIDHFFVSKNLGDKVVSSAIYVGEQIEKSSDHNPLVLTLNL